MVEKSRAESATGSVIGKTVTFEGDLQFSGTLFVAGRVIGNIASDSMEYAHLVIGSGGELLVIVGWLLVVVGWLLVAVVGYCWWR